MKALRQSSVIDLLFELGARWGGGSQHHASAASTMGKRRGTHCTGGWVGPRGSLDERGKIWPSPGLNSRTVQPLVSDYIDCGILAHSVL